MKKTMYLFLSTCIFMLAAGCAEDSKNSSPFISEVSNNIDISATPIEVGEYSTQTYTFRIANPFDNASNETADNASADVILSYNGTQVTNVIELDKDNTTAALGTDLIILSTTCGDSTAYGTVPTVMAKGESCEFTYKIAPKASFVFVNKLTVEYKKSSFFGTSSSSTTESTTSTVLNNEALIEKAKASGAYQLNETTLKYTGKRSAYTVNGTIYRQASTGTEINHIFSKLNGSLTNGQAGQTTVTETFDGGTNGATHTVTFLDLDNSFTAGTTASEAASSLANAKMNANTSLLTFYTYNFNSINNGCSADITNMSTNGTLTVTCNGGGQGELSIGLNIGADEYYKEKYLKSDKAYYVTSVYTADQNAAAQPSLNVYLWLEKNSITTSGTSSTDTNNIDLNVKCWTSLDATGAPSGSAIQLTNLKLDIFQKYDNTYNSDGTISSTAADYVLVKGMCGNIEVDTEYPLTSFTHLSTDAAPTDTTGLELYNPVETNTLDGIVRHNLMAR